MKTKGKYILLTGIASFVLLCMGSCIRDGKHNPAGSEPYGIMQIEIADAAAPTRSGTDWMKTIRFIVFTDLMTNPRAEINQLYTAGTLDFIPAVGDDPSAAKIFLKVARRLSGSNDKLVVAIVNEPDDVVIRDRLSAVTTPAMLEDIELDLSLFVADDHLSLKENAAIPMTGALWTNQVYPTLEQAAEDGNMVHIQVQRVVARVDVYLKKGTDVNPDLKMTVGTSVTLDNTYVKTFLARHTDNLHELGHIQTVATADLEQRSWALSSPGEHDISDAEPVCVFYTPERNHTADRLTLTIEVKTAEGATRSGQLEITKAFDKNNVEKPINEIRRNNVYKVIATIKANEITAEVRDWQDRFIKPEL